MANRIQLEIAVPHRHKVGIETQPPRTDNRRAYVIQLLTYFGMPIPPKWQSQASPEPQFSEPDGVVGVTEEPKKKVTRIKIK